MAAGPVRLVAGVAVLDGGGSGLVVAVTTPIHLLALVPSWCWGALLTGCLLAAALFTFGGRDW